ncbi:MAG TPA: competence/damage-inducible protein A [Bryobacteraceae bacterium]|nr:competence/damage-inducible protein A [Bryobacteraceae bacterium]
MQAEIIAVGSELLTPQKIDTDSLYLTGELNALGIEVVAKTVVGDDRERLSTMIRDSLRRSPIVFLTGGLGPTEDDVTRDAVAGALGRELQFNPLVCEGIEARFRLMNRRMAEVNRRQAYIIAGAEILSNENGTAPGQWVDDNGRIVILLPGPPNELKPMFARCCLPKLQAAIPRAVIRTRFYRVAGMPESELDQLISPVYTRYSNPVTTILAAPGDIQIHLRARTETEPQAEALLNELGAQIEELLGRRIYSCNGEPLEAVVGVALRRRGETLSVAESCTGGLLAGRITSVAGASDYFAGGFTTYTEAMKSSALSIDPELLRVHTAVSQPVAEAMALACRERTGSTYALSVTGVAGPGGGTEQNPVGTVYIGLAGDEGCDVRRMRFLGDRTRVRILAVQSALNLLRLHLDGESGR